MRKEQKKTGPPAEANDPVLKKFKLNDQVLQPEAVQLETVGQGNLNVRIAITVSCSAGLSNGLRTISDS